MKILYNKEICQIEVRAQPSGLIPEWNVHLFPQPSCKASSIIVPGVGTTKSWRSFVDKTETSLAPGSVHLYSEVVYISKDDLYIKLLRTPKSNGD